MPFQYTCPHCGSHFSRTPTQAKRVKAHYCSRACHKAEQAQDVATRFWSHVDRAGGPDACWPWTASRTDRGYGMFQLRGRNRRAHRVAFELTYGHPPECFACHACDNPSCCNPRHLYDGTPAQNSRDMIERGRTARRMGEQNHSAKLSDAQVREIRRRYAAGESQKALSRAFGVHRGHVSLLVHLRSRAIA